MPQFLRFLSHFLIISFNLIKIAITSTTITTQIKRQLTQSNQVHHLGKGNH